MGQLHDRMAQDLKLRGLSPCTQRNYLLYCRKFAAHFMRSPEELGAAEVRAFLLHQIEVEQLAYASYRQVYAALKFLYSVTLGRPGEVSRLPFPKRHPTCLPKVLTVDQLSAFFAAIRKPTANGWERSLGSPPSFTPGGKTCCFIHTCIASLLVAGLVQTAAAGSPLGPGTCCRSRYWPGCSAANS